MAAARKMKEWDVLDADGLDTVMGVIKKGRSLRKDRMGAARDAEKQTDHGKESPAGEPTTDDRPADPRPAALRRLIAEMYGE